MSCLSQMSFGEMVLLIIIAVIGFNIGRWIVRVLRGES
jgi:hypothetical protein